MLAAIILAAGESRRMGSSKPLLSFRRSSFLGHLLDELHASRARPILVDLGHEAERIRREVMFQEARPVLNPEYRNGMLSSIRAGLLAIADEERVEGAIVCPVDHPEIDADLVDTLIRRYEETGRPIVLPVRRGRRGHPVLFARSTFGEIMKALDSVGARQVVWNLADQVSEVATDHPGVTFDVDTPEEYEKLLARQ